MQDTTMQTEQTVTRMVVERERVIPTFFGDDPTQAPRFEEDIRRAWATVATGDTRQRMDIVLSNVGARVRAEVSCLEDETRRNPEDVLKHILNRFGERRSTDELLHQLMTIEQRPSETVMGYSHRTKAAFDALIKRQASVGEAPCPETLLRNRFARSVADRQLARHLRAMVLEKPDISFNALRESAMLWAEEEEPLVTQAAAVEMSAKTTPPPDPAIAALTERATQLEQLVREFLKNSSNSRGQGNGHPQQ